MPIINITVAGKIATNTTPGEVIVCGNSDYSVKFALDSEWNAEPNRTARFVYYKNGLRLYKDKEFTGDTVAVPVLSNIDYVEVGVYAGDLRTTTPAKVLCDRSILCGDPLEDLGPEEKAKLQAQIGDLGQLQTSDKSSLVAAINEAAQSGGLSSAAAALLVAILRAGVYTSDQSANITALEAALASSGDTGDNGDNTGGDETPDAVTLTSISAVYTGGDVAVGTAVADLAGVVVTATYSDGSTATVTGYTLNGNIAEGSNTVTVSYGGKTTTFTVTGVAEESEPVEVAMTTDNITRTDFTVYSDEGTSALDISNFNSPIPAHWSTEAFAEDTDVTITRSAMSSTTWKSLCIGECDANNDKVLYNAVRVDDGFGQDNNAAQFNYTVHAGRKIVIIRRTGSLSWFTITVTK